MKKGLCLLFIFFLVIPIVNAQNVTKPVIKKINYNQTIIDKNLKIFIIFSDDRGLHGFIYSENRSGFYKNSSYVYLSGTNNNSIISINPVNVSYLGLIFYVNDTDQNWCDEELIISFSEVDKKEWFLPLMLFIGIFIIIIMGVKNRKWV